MNLIKKSGLYLLSLFPFFLLFFVLYVDIPPIKFSSDYKFVGFKALITENYLPIISLFFIVIDMFIWIKIKGIKKNASILPATVIKVKRVNEGALDFAASILVPLVFIEVTSINSFIVLILSLAFIGCIYIKTDRIFSNPTLVIMGFTLYEITIQLPESKTEKNFILAKDTINISNRIQMTHISNNYYYALVIEVNNDGSK